jgi:hypothetical protein
VHSSLSHIHIIKMVQLKNSSKNRRRIWVLVFGMTAFMAMTFNFASMLTFQRDTLYAPYLPYLPEDVTEHAVASSTDVRANNSEGQGLKVQPGEPAPVLLGRKQGNDGGGSGVHPVHHLSAHRHTVEPMSAIQQANLKDSPYIRVKLPAAPQEELQRTYQQQQQRGQRASQTDNDSITAPALDLVESSRNSNSAVPLPLSEESTSPLSSSRSRVPSPSRSRSKNATVTDVAVAVVSVTDVVDVMDTITSQNSLCGGCRLAIIDPVTTCGDRIDAFFAEAKKNNRRDKKNRRLTLMQAAFKVAAAYPDKCFRCDPAACPGSELQYWRDVFSSVTKTNTIGTPTAPIQDSLCGGCRLAVITRKNPYLTCGDRIKSIMSQSQKNNSTPDMTMVQAAIQVAAVYPEKCSRCDPTACPDSEKLYWRFDQKAPVINYGRTHMLSSIPAAHRIPASALADLPSYFSNPANVVGPNKKYLYEYNPSIAILPPDQIPASLVVAAADDSYNKAVYVASYRVTDINLCMPAGGKQLSNPGDSGPLHQEYMGIAFLRADLSIIRDFTVDLHAALIRWQDFRLFNLAGKLYITGMYVIVPVWINVPADVARKKKKDIKVLYDMFQKEEDRTENDLTLSIRASTSCCSSPSCKGKNFNYFIAGGSGVRSSTTIHNNASTTKILVETNPIFPHTVDEVNLNQRCRQVQKEGKDTSVSTSEGPTLSHYSNMERIFFESGHNYIQQSVDRGTAGFVELEVPDDDDEDNNEKHESNNKWRTGQTYKSKQLLVGISHQKLYHHGEFKVKYIHSTYTSNLYAYEQTPPYRVVARSGAFCLGFPSEEESEQNYYSQLIRSRPLILKEEENCPQITFISGMTEKAGDDSKVILGYGINDCVPRFVEIEKSEIRRLLFNPTVGSNSSYTVL